MIFAPSSLSDRQIEVAIGAVNPLVIYFGTLRSYQQTDPFVAKPWTVAGYGFIRSARTGSAAFVDVYRYVERAKSKILHACRLLIPTCTRSSTQSRFSAGVRTFLDQILHGVVFERDTRHHLLEAGVFFFKLPHHFDG